MEEKRNVVIAGGGWSGISAAVTLCAASIPVTLYEMGHVLGGRARQVNIGDIKLDNGIHLLTGAYQTTLSTLKFLGLDNEHSALKRRPLHYVYDDVEIEFDRNPSICSRLISFLRGRGLTWIDKYKAIQFVVRIKQSRIIVDRTTSVRELLNKNQQTAQITEKFWQPLCLSALNLDIDRASAIIFLNVIEDAILSANANTNFLFPAVDLTNLFPERAEKYIRERNSEIVLGKKVKIKISNDRFFENVSDKEYTHAIIATAPNHVKHALEKSSLLSDTLEITNTLTYEPIYTIYHQFEARESTGKYMIGSSVPFPHWIFDRGLTHSQKGLIGVVISGKGLHERMKHDQLANESASFLCDMYGWKSPTWSKVIAEKRATFSCHPSIYRPTQKTRIKNLLLAGDYTYDRYPATIEGAMRSGVNAANIIINSL